MKRSISIGLAGIAGVIALLIAVPLLLPASLYKSQIEQIATGATGRAFTISGPLHFSLFPAFAIRADKVALANPPSFRGHDFATTEDVRFGLQLWPLLSGKIEITRIVLDRPAINLEVDAQGNANWIIHREKNADQGSSPRTPVAEQFSGIEIAHGHIGYVNLRSGTTRALDDINAVVNIAELSKPVPTEGTFTLSNRRVAFKATIATPELLLAEHTTALDVSMTSELAQIAFRGTIDPAGSLDGTVSINTNSVRAAATWLGARLPESGGLGQLLLRSHVSGDDRHIRLAGMAMTIDGMKATGDLSLDTSTSTPYAKGAITIDHIDLNPYIERPHRPGVVHPHPDNERWSDAPITLALLKKANADLTVDVGSLTLRKLHLDRSHLTITLNNAILDAHLDPMALYGGTGKAVLHADARATPAFHNVVEFSNVALQAFLSSTIGVKQIEGTGTIKLDVTSRGDSTDIIMHGLSGRGSIDLHDGQLRGLDLGAVAKTIQGLLGGAVTPDAFTKFSTMRGSFVLANGILTGNDFQLEGPALHTTGVGTVDIGNRAIDFKIVPQASAVVAKQKLSVGLPFRIKGPWKHVHYTADIGGLVNSVLDNLKSGRVPFKDMFGSSKPKDPNAPKKKHKNIGDALKNMFGIH